MLPFDDVIMRLDKIATGPSGDGFIEGIIY